MSLLRLTLCGSRKPTFCGLPCLPGWHGEPARCDGKIDLDERPNSCRDHLRGPRRGLLGQNLVSRARRGCGKSQSQQELSSEPQINDHVEGAGGACAQGNKASERSEVFQGSGLRPDWKKRLSPLARSALLRRPLWAEGVARKNSPSDSEDHSGRAATANHPDGQGVGGRRSTYTNEESGGA